MAEIGKNISVAILGPGAIGGLLASVLWKHGVNVTCIGTAEDVAAIQEKGIRFESEVFGKFTATPEAAISLVFAPDILFIAVKAPFLSDALSLIQPEFVRNALVIPLLNGFSHIDIIRKKIGNKVAVGMIGSVESSLAGRGHIKHVTRMVPHIELASDHDLTAGQLKSAAELLSSAGFEVRICAKEAEVIWNKLARLSVISLLTAAAQRPLGEIRSDPHWNQKLSGCIAEIAEIAASDGVMIAPENLARQIDELPAHLTTSLQRDIAVGAVSELEAIHGSIIKLASEKGIACPRIKEIYNTLLK